MDLWSFIFSKSVDLITANHFFYKVTVSESFLYLVQKSDTITLPPKFFPITAFFTDNEFTITI